MLSRTGSAFGTDGEPVGSHSKREMGEAVSRHPNVGRQSQSGSGSDRLKLCLRLNNRSGSTNTEPGAVATGLKLGYGVPHKQGDDWTRVLALAC